MDVACLSAGHFAAQAGAAILSITQVAKLKKYISTAHPEPTDGSDTPVKVPRMCVVISENTEKASAVSTLRTRGFVVMSILTDKETPDRYTVLLKVGPKLFPKLAVGLSMPLQPTAMYTQGELYRIYDAAMLSVDRATQLAVLQRYLEHDVAVVSNCLRHEKTTDVIDYFGLDFGLMFDFVRSYKRGLFPVAVVAFIMKAVVVVQYVLYHTCSARFSFLFPAVVSFWSIVSLTVWRQRAIAQISAIYSGLLLGMVRGSTASMFTIQGEKIVKILLCGMLVGILVMFYVSVLSFVKESAVIHPVFQYFVAIVYSIIPPLLSKPFTQFLRSEKKNYVKNVSKPVAVAESENGLCQQSNKAAVSNPRASPASSSSSIFALEIFNYHGGLFYLHFVKNDYEAVQTLLVAKLVVEQLVDMVRNYQANKQLSQRRDTAGSDLVMEDPPSEPLSATRIRSNSGVYDNARRYSYAQDELPKFSPGPGSNTGSPRAGDLFNRNDKSKKVSAAQKFLRKITRRKKSHEEDNSDTTSVTETTLSPDLTELDTDVYSRMREALEVDVKAKRLLKIPDNFTPPSRSQEKFCLHDLMDDFKEHLAFQEFDLTAAYARILVLHGYLVLFSPVHPLSIILIYLQLRYVVKLNLIQVANSLRTNFSAGSSVDKTTPIPERLSKAIEKAKAEDNPHPTVAKSLETQIQPVADKDKDDEGTTGGQLAENMMSAAASSIRSDALFCFYINVINVVAIFSNAMYLFHNSVSSSMAVLESLCHTEVSVGGDSNDVATVCSVFSTYAKCSGIVFLLLGAKLIIDTFVSDCSNNLSEIYKNFVSEQFTQALKFRLSQFQKRSTVAREVETLGKALYSTNIRLQRELSDVKLHRIYAQCERHGSSLTFVVLTMLPIVTHVFLQFPWYVTLFITAFLHLYFSNRSGRQYQNAALQVISDHNLLNHIREVMPMWTFHDTEPCGWANDLLTQCWDQINAYGSKKARDKLEAILERTKPPMLKRMGLRKIGFGDTPPKIHSVRTFNQDSGKTKMELEVDVTWLSECFMQLEIVNHGGAELMFEICNVKFSGTVRVQCTPLIPDVPPFEYARITFLKPPVIDFSLKIGDGGGFDFVDPIANAVQRALKRALVTVAQYPKWINILIDEKKKKRMTDEELSSHEAESFALEPVGVLTVSIEGCNNLPIADITSSDPFVEIHFMEETYKTNVVYRSLNPRWNGECFDLLVFDVDAQSVNFTVWDYDLGAINNDFLGEVDIPLSTLTPNVAKTIETRLYDNSLRGNNKMTSTIMLSMVYIPLRAKSNACRSKDDGLVGDDDILLNVDLDGVEYDEMSGAVSRDKLGSGMSRRRSTMQSGEIGVTSSPVPGSASMANVGGSMVSLVSTVSDDEDDEGFALADVNQDHPVTGALLISNISCRRLAHGDEKCDPYVTVSMGAVKRKTKVIKASTNPIFGESFTFVLRDPDEASFVMKVKNNKKKLFGHSMSRQVSNGFVKFSLGDIYPFMRSNVVTSGSYGTRKMEFELVGGKNGSPVGGSIYFTVKHICA